MAEKKKTMIFTPTKESPSSPRKPFILLADRDSTRDEPKESAERDKPPTIILRTREQSAPKDERPISPKNEELDFPQPSKIAYNDFKEKKIEQRPAPTHKSMTEPVKLLDENLDVYSPALEYLSDTNTQFVIIGVIGSQGVGKSLVLNLLSHDNDEDFCQTILDFNSKDDISTLENDIEHLSLMNGTENPDKHSGLKFKMQTIEHMERNGHCTKGIEMFITKDRTIYLDCQAVGAPALGEETDARGLAGLQLASFLMSVCHVVIAVQDWIVDYNFIRCIQTAEMLMPTLSTPAVDDELTISESNPHLVLLHNRCRFEDYLPNTVKALQDVYRVAFEKSSLQLHSGVYMYSELSTGGRQVDQLCNGYNVENCGMPINMFFLPEVKDESDITVFHGRPPLKQLAARLRRQLLGAPRHQLTNVANLTEKAWFHFCHRAWETIRTSSFFIEYERLLP